MKILIAKAEMILDRAAAISNSPDGNPLRSDQIAENHRDSVRVLREILEMHKGFAEEHLRLVSLVSQLRDELTKGMNGSRFWLPTLPQRAKTILALINVHMRTK